MLALNQHYNIIWALNFKCYWDGLFECFLVYDLTNTIKCSPRLSAAILKDLYPSIVWASWADCSGDFGGTFSRVGSSLVDTFARYWSDTSRIRLHRLFILTMSAWSWFTVFRAGSELMDELAVLLLRLLSGDEQVDELRSKLLLSQSTGASLMASGLPSTSSISETGDVMEAGNMAGSRLVERDSTLLAISRSYL